MAETTDLSTPQQDSDDDTTVSVGGAVRRHHVLRAETEAVEAADLVDALEERVRDGDDEVTPEQIETQRGLARFARLRAEATRRKADQAARDARLAALGDLHAQIDGHAEDGARFVALLVNAEAALTEFLTAVADRNAALVAWREDLAHHGVPQLQADNPPAPEHGDLGHTEAHVVAGRRRLATFNPGPAVQEAVQRAITASGTRELTSHVYGGLSLGGWSPNETSAPYATVAALDETR